MVFSRRAGARYHGLLLLVAGLLIALALAFGAPARPASAVKQYSTITGQPCIACHSSSITGALNNRGAAFAVDPAHTSDVAGVWAKVKDIDPGPVDSGGSPGTLITVVVVGIAAVVGVLLSRRTRRLGR